MNRKTLNLFLCFLLASTTLFSLTGCSETSSPKLKSEYQAIYLTSGQTFFGKAEFSGDYILVREAYYIQSQVEKDKNQVKNILVRRGQEWHGPDLMYINSRNVALLEPVAPDSRVAQLIKASQAEKPK